MNNKLLGIIIVLSIATHSTRAQKLPNVQQKSLQAPTNIKVDGKSTEWDNQFQAYNNATQVYYTLANDKENIYLVIQARDASTIEKMISGGVTFSIFNIDKKNKVDPATFTFPLTSKNTGFAIYHYITDTEDSIESELPAINNQLTTDSKQIRITGINGIDSLISVYNDNGIKATSLIDSKRAYTYELAVPLKYITPVISSENSFKYNIKLNGLKASEITILVNGKAVQPNFARMGNGYGLNRDLYYPTDFSATYALIK